jgi:hypothetical protein
MPAAANGPLAFAGMPIAQPPSTGQRPTATVMAMPPMAMAQSLEKPMDLPIAYAGQALPAAMAYTLPANPAVKTAEAPAAGSASTEGRATFKLATCTARKRNVFTKPFPVAAHAGSELPREECDEDELPCDGRDDDDEPPPPFDHNDYHE